MPLSSRSTRLLRLLWLAGLLALTVVSVAALALLAAGMVLPGVAAVGLCAAGWWWLARAFRGPAEPAQDAVVAATARLIPVRARLRRVTPMPPVPPETQAPTPTSAPSSAIKLALSKLQLPALTLPATGAQSSAASTQPMFVVGIIIGMLMGVLVGALLARALPSVPALGFALAIVAIGTVGVGGLAVWQWSQTGQWVRAERAAMWAAFALALGVFAVTRFVSIADFPIYFFTDEAVNTVRAADLLRNGLRDAQGNVLPAYFPNGLYVNLSLSVYVQAVGLTLFGKSIELVRATFAFFALLGAAAIGLSMKWAFRQRWWWLAVLFLAAMPAWFLHSRTGFETVLMVSFYSGFILFYLLYRTRDPRWLFPAIVCGACAFYAYTNGQVIMFVTGLLLLISDIRYHARHWRTGIVGVLLIAIAAAPYVRFRTEYPEAIISQLRILDSYWLQPISLGDKLLRFVNQYTYGLSPLYWFVPNDHDLQRHLMKGYGLIALWMLPFWLAGLWVCIRNFKTSMYRVVLIALVASPFGAALAEIFVTRALAYVVPSAMLCALGAEWMLSAIGKWRPRVLAGALGSVALSAASLLMLNDALTNGPLWYTNYGLYGLQWGAKQLFVDTVPVYLREHPDRRLLISPTWANGTDMFTVFFDVDSARVQLINIDYFISRKEPLADTDRLVMTQEEIDRANSSGKFAPLDVEQVISAPDGSPAFTVAHVRYVNNIDEVFAIEAEEKARPVTDTVRLGNEAVQVAHSRLDMGQPQDIFDGDTFSLARGESANPLLLDVTFAQPRAVKGIDAVFAKMDFTIKAIVFGVDGSQREYTQTYRDLPGEPSISLEFPDAPASVTRVKLLVTQLNAPEEVHIHVREISFR